MCRSSILSLVQFFFLFLVMLIHEFKMNIKQRKMKIEPGIKLISNIYTIGKVLMSTFYNIIT